MKNAKIAHLPHQIREQLNHRLQNGEQTKTLLHWLNALPEVKALLEAEFGGHPLNKQTLSDWELGGFREWQNRQDALDFVRTSPSGSAIRPGQPLGTPDGPVVRGPVVPHRPSSLV